MYTTSQLATQFNVTAQTVKRYAAEFAAYLSPTATPEKNMPRRFTDDDLAVYALIVSMKEEGKLFEQIHAALGSGQRGQAPEPNPSNMTVAQSTAQLRLIARIRDLETQLTTEQQERRKAELSKAEAEGQNRLLRDMLREANAEVARLNRLLGDDE